MAREHRGSGAGGVARRGGCRAKRVGVVVVGMGQPISVAGLVDRRPASCSRGLSRIV